VMAGFGAPVSEDLVLLAGGMVAAAGNANLLLMILTAWTGVLAGDSALFRIGRSFGARPVKLRFLDKLVTPERVRRVNYHFARHGMLTIFIVRFCMGLRVPTFVTAGMSGMRYSSFLAADALAALVYAPALVWLGWRFGEVALHDIEATLKWLPIAALTVAGALFAARVVRRRRQRRSAHGALRDVFFTAGELPHGRAKDAV
jgi:membrane-associated protein